MLTLRALVLLALVGPSLCRYFYSYEPGIVTEVTGTSTTNAVLPADDMTLDFETTGGSTDVVITAHIGRVQHSTAATSIFFVVTVDSVVIAEQEQGDRYGYLTRPMSLVVAATGLTPGTHTVQLLYRTTSGTARFLYEPCGTANQYISVIRPAALYQAVVSGSEALPLSASYTAFPTDVSVSVTVGTATALLIFVEVDKHQHTVANSLGHYRITVDGVQTCTNAVGNSQTSHFRSIVFSCVHPVSAGAHTVQLQYKLAANGATIQNERRLIAVPLHATQSVSYAFLTHGESPSADITSTTWTDFPLGGLSLTYTAVVDEQIFVFLSVGRVQTSPTDKCVRLRILLDDTTTVAEISAGGPYSYMYAAPSLSGVASLTAGTHTFKAQAILAISSSTASFLSNSDGEGQSNLYVVGAEILAGIQGDPLLTRLDGSSIHVQLREGVYNLFSSPNYVANVLVDTVTTLPPEENTVVVGVGVLTRSDGLLTRSYCGVSSGSAECFLDHHWTQSPGQPLGDGFFLVVPRLVAVVVVDEHARTVVNYAPSPFFDVAILAAPQPDDVTGLVGCTEARDVDGVAHELALDRYTVCSGCIFGVDAPSSVHTALPNSC